MARGALRFVLAAVLAASGTGFGRAQDAAVPDPPYIDPSADFQNRLDNWVRALLGKFGRRSGTPRTPISSVRPQAGDGVLRVVSWNMQTFGARVKEARLEASRAVLGRMFSADPSAHVFAAQEIAQRKAADAVDGLLPDGAKRWKVSFEDTSDPQNNALFADKAVTMDCERSIATAHPARAAHIRMGELDFTLITVHLIYKGGDSRASADELRQILDWVRDYLARPGSDPDVVIAGDFNMPTRKGKEASHRAHERGWTPVEDVIDAYPSMRLFALVDDLTSRAKGAPANNYDHFIITGDLYDEEYIQGSAGVLPADLIEAIERDKGALASDHYPVSAAFRTSGVGNDGRPIHLDGDKTCGR